MPNLIKLFLFLGVMLSLSFSHIEAPVWGFFGHRLINRTAVYALPSQIFGFYKKHIDYIEYHSIDPDKRRYAAKNEAVRHYIDLDMWDDYDYLVKEPLGIVMLRYAKISQGEEVWYDGLDPDNDIESLKDYEQIQSAYDTHGVTLFYEDAMELPITLGDGSTVSLKIEDQFKEHGILPYHLMFYYRKLESAFIEEDVDLILRYSSEIGHYISDAHVPLHTTKNYDGQLTGQKGIHAFWESRIPELFAFTQYDLFVDQAQYIEDIEAYMWDVVLDTHRLVDDVLSIESNLSANWPKDQQYCYDQRGASVVRLQCEAYAKAYQDAMQDMVETQMRKSIPSLASIWYTAWSNGGQPELKGMKADVISSPQIENEELPHLLRDANINPNEYEK